jgi:hypothetical protein
MMVDAYFWALAAAAAFARFLSVSRFARSALRVWSGQRYECGRKTLLKLGLLLLLVLDPATLERAQMATTL